MELESLNKEYLLLKKILKDSRQEEKTLNEQLKLLINRRTRTSADLEDAKILKDQAEIKRLNIILKKIDDEIQEVKSKAKLTKEQIDSVKEMIQTRVDEVRNNEALKYHLDTALATRYDRQLGKIDKEKEKVVKQKNGLSDLLNLFNNHRTLMNNAKGIASASQTIEKLKDELKSLEVNTGGTITYSNQSRADVIKNNLIPAAKNKLQKNKTALKDYIKRKKINIPEEAIDQLEKIDYKISRKGNVDISKALKKQINTYDSEIAKLDKKRAQYENAYNGMPEEIKQEVQNKKNRTAPSTSMPNQDEGNNFKWYNFIKRFKAWRERRNQPQLSEPTIREDAQQYINSLKYDIVKDYVKTTERDDLKRAKTQDQERNDGGR